MKKLASMLLALVLACVALTGAMAEEAVDPQELLHAVSGTYTELFPVICAPEYDDVWLDRSAEYAGEEYAEMVAEILKSACTDKTGNTRSRDHGHTAHANSLCDGAVSDIRITICLTEAGEIQSLWCVNRSCEPLISHTTDTDTKVTSITCHGSYHAALL